MLVFAGVAFQWGQPTFAWLLVVGFALFLRTGEILQLAPHHVTLAKNSAIIFVEGSNDSKRTFLPLERLEIDEPTALLALRNVVKKTSVCRSCKRSGMICNYGKNNI